MLGILTLGCFIIAGSLIKQLCPIFLGSDCAGKMEDNHLKKSISCRQPLPHHNLKKKEQLIRYFDLNFIKTIFKKTKLN